MKTEVKRIIAREGLIIITLIVLAGLSLLIDQGLRESKSTYAANVQEVEPALFLEKDKYGVTGVRLIELKGIILRFPKDTHDDVMEQTMRRDFPNIKFDELLVSDSPKGENINASYDNKGKRVFNSILYKIYWDSAFEFFLICAYPIYWTIRFIIWAIGTLRVKKIDA